MDSSHSADLSNPMSEAFRREAARNVQQNIASMRTEKDLRGDDAEDLFESTAGRAGEAKAGDGPGAGRAGTGDGAAVSVGEGDRAQAAADRAGAAGLLQDRDPRLHRRRREEAKRLAEDGVPVEILQASKHIVEGQVDPVRGPNTHLKQIKTPPDMARVELKPADYQPVMPIHDEANRPLLDESDT